MGSTVATVVKEVLVGNASPGMLRTELAPNSGSLICWRDFDVQRPGRNAHRVSVEIGEDGYFQEIVCDCRGFQYRHDCAHINAVLEFMDAEKEDAD